ncbi:uncharacterized protein LOC124122930 [Haliotis rufescens]|uniref:uncharacterized protein LOC124122930 n=1 Tax=Haliotis rufescens TaxID=6454 RepID=UPI00201EBD2F|nr:uncharacterized protein LOC124122930 [Haliotis rufescens]
MNWVRLSVYAAILVNFGLLLTFVTLTAWGVQPDQAPRISSEETVVETLRQQVNLSRSEDTSVSYQRDVEKCNGSRPALHQGFTIQDTSQGSSIVKLDVGAATEAMTAALLQGFQLDDGAISVLVSGNYVILMDVTYFFRGHVDGSQVKVYVTCVQSDPAKDLVQISQLCRKGRYCSLTFQGISYLSQTAKLHCEANHASDIVTAIVNTHISLAFY